MKKKGLIISTAVMVVVLIAALTTGTFAWFTSTTENKIDPISVEVKSSTTVIFGVHKNGYNAAETNTDNCVNGQVSWAKKTDGKADGTWTGDPNLGSLDLSQVITSSKVSFTKAVGTADLLEAQPSAFKGTPDTSFDTTHSIIKAEGTSNTDITESTAEYAVENTDYIHLPLGIVLVDSSKTSLKCKITLKLNDENKNLGLAAGLHIIYQKGSEEIQDVAFFEDTHNAGTAKTTAGYDESNGVSKEIELEAEIETLQNLDLFIILAGYDKDTSTAAAAFGLNAEITIEFVTD